MDQPNFIDYLKLKKVDPEAFRNAEPQRFADYAKVYVKVHPNSFTQQKMFVINDLRRRYPFTGPPPERAATVKKAVKPKINIKPKLK